jgi:hypothetical protein
VRAARDRWITLAVGMATLFHLGIARAEAVVRKPSEGDDDFMARVLGPSADLAQKVVRSTEMTGGKLTLIGFVNFQDDSKDHSQGGDSLVGHVLIETSPGHYEHVKFPSCDEEGGPPQLEAVFFARTAKGAARDLGVLCSWYHGGQANNGSCYSAQFYRVKEAGAKTGVEPVTDLNKKFDTCDSFESTEHGKWARQSKASFKTVAQVKKLLTKMGLAQ